MKKYKINISEEPHCKDLESLGSIFTTLLKSALTSEDMVGVDVIINWKEIVGKEISAFCFPLKTKFDARNTIRTLFVEVPSGGFALEIQHRENYILNKINNYFGYCAIHKLNVTQNINIKIGIPANSQEEKDEQTTCLSEEEKEYLQSLVAEIKNENLRKILIKIGENVIKSKKE